MIRESSWLVGAWVHLSDGMPEPSWSLIGMVARHAEWWREIGYVDPGCCTILLHDLDKRIAYGLLSGQTFTYRFVLPGLVVEWDAFAEAPALIPGEARQLRIEFTGPPRIIEADERWDAFTRSVGSLPMTRG